MVDYATRIRIRQRFKGQAVTFLFLIDPRAECLFHDPAARAFKTLRQFVDFLG
jgi:hypothetical protein